MPTTASSDSAEKSPAPGRSTISTPSSPTPTATQRRQPTRSWKNRLPPSTTSTGVACRIAVVVDSGVSAIASA